MIKFLLMLACVWYTHAFVEQAEYWKRYEDQLPPYHIGVDMTEDTFTNHPWVRIDG